MQRESVPGELTCPRFIEDIEELRTSGKLLSEPGKEFKTV